MKRHLRCILSWTVLALLIAAPVRAQNADYDMAKRQVSVSGEGTITVEPDRATVRFGIVTRAERAELARQQNADSAAAAMNAVRGLDIPEEKIKMEGLQLQPWREYNPKTRQYDEKGFEATRRVSVVLDDLEQLPTLVARVVQQGANRLQGINYELQDRESVRNDALREAAENARDKARLLAETLGARLGPVRMINEQSFSMPPMRVRSAEMTAMAAKTDAQPEPDAYAAGEMEVTASVQVSFDLIATVDQE